MDVGGTRRNASTPAVPLLGGMGRPSACSRFDSVHGSCQPAHSGLRQATSGTASEQGPALMSAGSKRKLSVEETVETKARMRRAAQGACRPEESVGRASRVSCRLLQLSNA